MVESTLLHTRPFRLQVAAALEQTAFVASLVAAGWAVFAAFALTGAGWTPRLTPASGQLAAATLASLVPFYLVLARRWRVEWPVYLSQAALVGAYLAIRSAHPLSAAAEAAVLLLFCYLDFGIAEVLDRSADPQAEARLYARPLLRGALLLPLVTLGLVLGRGLLEPASLFTLFSLAAFYALVSYQREAKPISYAAAAFFNVFLWCLWAKMGWRLADHPQFYLVPVGLSAILFAEANRRELGRAGVNALRSGGLVVIYLSTAEPMWRLDGFGPWLTMLLLSLGGILTGIALRAQSFVWLGLGAFCFAVLYPLGRASLENPLARWAVMLGLGISLLLFVAVSEKKRIFGRLRACYECVRQWE